MATLAISNNEILENLALVIGVDRTVGNWDPEVTADANRIIRAGRRKFFMAHAWSFLEDDIDIVTEVPFEVTGTCVNGVITTVGTLPASPVGNYKCVPQTDSGVYDIAATAVNQLTLVDTNIDFDNQTIVLYRFRYPLPTNFAAFIDPVYVENWQDYTQLREYATLPDFTVRGVLNRSHLVTGPPEIFCTTQVADAETGNFDFYIELYPFPAYSVTDNTGDAYTLRTTIRIQPGDTLEEDGDDPVFHPVFSELMQEAILATAEIMYTRTAGVHTALFGELLPAAIQRDRQLRGTRRLLPRATDLYKTPNLEIRRAEIDLTNALLP